MRLVNRTFDELQPGERAEVRRLVTADELYVYAVSSGNFNPMHLPHADLDGDGTPERVAPGMFVASLDLGCSGHTDARPGHALPPSGAGCPRPRPCG